MSVSKKTLGGIVLQLALALFLIVSGILTLQLNGSFWGKLQVGISGNEVVSAVRSLLKGDPANVVIIVLGVCELIAGIFLLANFFVETGKISNTFIYVVDYCCTDRCYGAGRTFARSFFFGRSVFVVFEKSFRTFIGARRVIYRVEKLILIFGILSGSTIPAARLKSVSVH